MKIVFAFFSYLLGSVPVGYFLYFLTEKKDIRRFGSQSIGATNVLRLKGWTHAVPVMIFDILKGFFPVYLAMKLFPDRPFAYLCGFLAVIGHCFPVFIKFKGGKGVATSVGAFAAVALPQLLAALIIFVIVVALTRFVSLGSLMASLSLPISAFIWKGDTEIAIFGTAIFLIILVRHLGNIQRLIKGVERKLGERSG